MLNLFFKAMLATMLRKQKSPFPGLGLRLLFATAGVSCIRCVGMERRSSVAYISGEKV
jgi:hypothetical protein